MNEKASHGRTLTRRDRCMRIITGIFRDGRDHEIRDALQSVLAYRGLSALTDAAIEDLATRINWRGAAPARPIPNSVEAVRGGAGRRHRLG
jgi:hypothetical protein